MREETHRSDTNVPAVAHDMPGVVALPVVAVGVLVEAPTLEDEATRGRGAWLALPAA